MARKVGRVGKLQKRGKRSANRADFAKMLVEASAVVMEHRGRNEFRAGYIAYVLFRFPYWVKFSPTFPPRKLVEKDDETNTYKINAVKLLNWLYVNGHSTYDAKMLVSQTKRVEAMMNQLDREFNF